MAKKRGQRKESSYIRRTYRAGFQAQARDLSLRERGYPSDQEGRGFSRTACDPATDVEERRFQRRVKLPQHNPASAAVQKLRFERARLQPRRKSPQNPTRLQPLRSALD
jgi:hypothetical protein